MKRHEKPSKLRRRMARAGHLPRASVPVPMDAFPHLCEFDRLMEAGRAATAALDLDRTPQALALARNAQDAVLSYSQRHRAVLEAEAKRVEAAKREGRW